MIARLLMSSALFVTGAATLAFQDPASEEPAAAVADLTGEGIWELLWDDDVSGLIGETPHRATCELHFIEDKVTGRFHGKVGGTERDALFTGETIDGGNLVVLQQRETGYTCAYQVQRSSAGVLWGVWHDTCGRRGDVVFRRVE